MWIKANQQGGERLDNKIFMNRERWQAGSLVPKSRWTTTLWSDVAKRTAEEVYSSDSFSGVSFSDESASEDSSSSESSREYFLRTTTSSSGSSTGSGSDSDDS